MRRRARPLPPVTVVPAKETREQKRLRKIAEADARNQAKDAAKAAKPPKPARAAAAPKAGSKRAEIQAAAERGELPTPPDFTADTHKRFRPVLQKLVDAANAGDLKTLRADTTEPKSSSRVAVCRYRDLAIVALQARAKQAKAA
jgi:predicted lipid-binding transport protein (Tim44 family)